MSIAQIIRSLQVKVACIAGESNSGRVISAAVLADACKELQDLLKQAADSLPKT